MKQLLSIVLVIVCYSSSIYGQSCRFPLIESNTDIINNFSDNVENGKKLLMQQRSSFEENRGQVTGEDANEVTYVLRKNGLLLFLKEDGLSYQFTKTHYPEGYDKAGKNAFSREEMDKRRVLEEQIRTETYRVDVVIEGANTNAKCIREKQSSDYTNYYNHGIEKVHQYEKIVYKDIYPNIDWEIYLKNGIVKYDFVVRPGGDPNNIVLRIDHAESINIKENGDLLLKTRMGEIVEESPVSFQGNKKIKTAFERKNNHIRFTLKDNYNPLETLTIDPTLEWATYYGDTGAEENGFCTVDASGDVYLTGYTYSSTGIAGHQNTYGNFIDAFLVKFNSAGIRQWATYYGGTNSDYANHCTVDATGNVYLTGKTSSSANIASGGHQNTIRGISDAFLVKFNSAGTRQWATYYGGASAEESKSCWTNGSGDVYIAGSTYSTSLIASGGHQTTFGGGGNDAFLVKFNSTGVRQWATYYGGNAPDYGVFCSGDESGNVYLAGDARSSSGIASEGYDNTIGSSANFDAFLVKFNNDGVRQWGTYYGDSEIDQSLSCSTDGSGNVYLVGTTSSTSGIASGGHQDTYGSGSADGFLVKFNSAGARQWATYYGGDGTDDGLFCSTDASGNVYMAGSTSSSTNIASEGHQNTYGGSTDAYLVKFNSAGVRQWATYYGGDGTDKGKSCIASSSDVVYLAGTSTSSTSIASGGHQNTLGGTLDLFLAKFSPCVSATTGTDVQTACGSYTWINGTTYTASNNTDTYTIAGGAANGCDSVVTLNLTITNSATGTDVQTACSSYMWINGTTYTASNNTDTYTIVGGAANGCDSIVTLNLTITNSATGTDVQTACGTYTWINGTTYTASNNTDTYTIVGGAANGCDSIVTLNLTINNSTTGTDVQTACGSYTWINGTTYTTSNNTATHILTNDAGCDSLVTLNLTINTINTGIAQNGATLTANATGVTYQWLNCSDMQSIVGETNQVFTAVNNGAYAVEISDGTCTDTSACINVTGLAIEKNDFYTTLAIYPNPTNGQLTIDLGATYKEITVTITDVLGKTINKTTYYNIQQISQEINATATGVYLLTVTSDSNEAVFRILKE